MRPTRPTLITAGALVAGLLLPAAAASAQGVCQALWYDRNAIYARSGFCFQSARAIEQFGRACFPPYGRLSPGDQRRVNEIQDQEDMRGCPR